MNQSIHPLPKRQASKWKARLVGITGGILFFVFCCGMALFVFGFISFPSTEVLARRYLNAVLNEDEEAAAALAGNQSGCRSFVLEDARKDIQLFGGAEIQNVTIEILGNTGSDDEAQFAIVEFEYRRPGETKWQRGAMRLVTDYPVPGFRYLCGNLMYQGP